MSFRLALLLALLLGLLVAYLTSVNPAGVRLALPGIGAYDLPLLVLIIGALLVGAMLGFVLGMFRDVGRAHRDRRWARHDPRAEALGELYHRAVRAQRAGRATEAVHTYEEILRREPTHGEALSRLGEMARQRGDSLSALGYDQQALRAKEGIDALLAVAGDYHALGRADEAVQMYQRVLARDREHLTALRGLRDVTAGHGRWSEALDAQERLMRVAPREDRAAEEAWLAGIQYEMGRALLTAGETQAAATRFRDALRTRPDFMPAALALGDALVKTGETREALRVWERALETEPIPPLLSRIEQIYRAEGRPARMIWLYRDATMRHPGNLAVAFGLGRAYFELAMLDEAAEQFQKIEVQAPDLPSIHAYLGAIFERHGQIREAFEEYRRALRFPESLEWAHRCVACAATRPSWFDRCPACRRWNTARP